MVFCTPVKIGFLGVWDTVGSVGVLQRKTLPWIEYNPSVKVFRQALALDENRGNFLPSVWDHSKTFTGQSAVEVWFKGGHSDVGGGAPLLKRSRKNYFLENWRQLPSIMRTGLWKRPGPEQSVPPLPSKGGPNRLPDLSNISLRWMVQQCLELEDVRVLFDPYAIRSYRRAEILEKHELDVTKEQKILRQRRELDDFDITPEPYISLDMNPLFWWFLELLPVPKLSQYGSNRSRLSTVYRPNLGMPRTVNQVEEQDCIRIHSSAYRQIQSVEYKHAAQWYSCLKQAGKALPRVEDKLKDDDLGGLESLLRIRRSTMPDSPEHKAGHEEEHKDRHEFSHQGSYATLPTRADWSGKSVTIGKEKDDRPTGEDLRKYSKRLILTYAQVVVACWVSWAAFRGFASLVGNLYRSELLKELFKRAGTLAKRVFFYAGPSDYADVVI
ncbi:hypothetical protein RhiTH_010768 [Rhizoctonia solani]